MDNANLILSLPYGILADKISAIKGVRALTLMGLKESKDLIESLMIPGKFIKITVDPSVTNISYQEAINRINTSGITITYTKSNNIVRKTIAKQLSEMVTYATLGAQYDIASALIEVIKTHCPGPIEDENEVNDERNE